jgi:hypothetical protein
MIRSHCSLLVKPSNVLGVGSIRIIIRHSPSFSLLEYLVRGERGYAIPRRCSASFRTASKSVPFEEVARRGESRELPLCLSLRPTPHHSIRDIDQKKKKKKKTKTKGGRAGIKGYKDVVFVNKLFNGNPLIEAWVQKFKSR